MSPRAAWRLTQLGFSDVYDFVGSKMEWIGAGLPFEGTLADEVKLGDLADVSVPTCGPADTVETARDGLGDWPICLVVNHERVVLGLLRAEALGLGTASVLDLMQEGPSTYRPHVTAAEMASKLDQHPVPYIVVTTLDGKLVGVTDPDAVRKARKEEPSP